MSKAKGKVRIKAKIETALIFGNWKDFALCLEIFGLRIIGIYNMSTVNITEITILGFCILIYWQVVNNGK